MVDFLDWKIIVTVLITLIALLVALGNHPAVKGFFAAVSERFPSLGEESVNRNVSFTVTLDQRDVLALATTRKINITANASELLATAKDVNVNGTNKELRIVGYTGFLMVNGSVFGINGSFDRFEVNDVFIVRGPVHAEGIFTELSAEDLSLREYKTNSSGLLIVEDNEIKFNEIRIENPLGKFVFNGGLIIEGLAKKIVIGKIVIV